MKRLLFLTLLTAFSLICSKDGGNVAGTVDDTNSGSLFGRLLTKASEKTTDTVTVELYAWADTGEAPAEQTDKDVPLRTLTCTDGSYEFDSLAAGTYTIMVIREGIVIGGKDAVTLKENEDKEVDITIVIIINQTFNIRYTDNSRNITIININMDNGTIEKQDSGYMMTTAENDTLTFNMEIEKDGDTGTVTARIIRDEYGNPKVEIVDGEDENIKVTIPAEIGSVAGFPGDTTIDEGQELTFTLNATDPDGDSIGYLMLIHPEGAELQGRIFSWTPGSMQSGAHVLKFLVTDNGSPQYSDSVFIIVTVNNVDSLVGDSGKVIEVKPGGGAYELVSDAVKNASSGDTILVYPGTYIDTTIVIAQKSLVLKSTEGAANTILTASSNMRTIQITDARSTFIDGFTIDNAQNNGSGILFRRADTVTIINCIFRHNTFENINDDLGLTNRGGAIQGGTPNPDGFFLLKNNVFYGNSANDGAAVYTLSDCRIHIVNNLFFNNRAPDFGNCIWTENTTAKALVVIDHVTISKNSSSRGYAIDANGGNGGSVTNSIIYDNAGAGAAAAVFSLSHTMTSDPSFVDASENDFRLQPGSPAVDSGDPDSPKDPDGTRADMGVIFDYLPPPYGP